MYPPRIYNVCVKREMGKLKSNILFNNVSPMKNGLNEAIFLIIAGNVSIGKMLDEKKRKINPREMVAMVPVSSDLKTLPMIIPKRINTVVININTSIIPPIVAIKYSLKK